MAEIAFTTAGQTAAWNTAGDGFDFSVTHFRLWSGSSTPAADTEEGDLGTQRWPESTSEYADITSTVQITDQQYEFRIHLDSSVGDSTGFTFQSIGLYLNDGSNTLFAVIVLDDAFTKTEDNEFRLNIPMRFDNLSDPLEIVNVTDAAPARIVEVADLESLGKAANAGSRTTASASYAYEFTLPSTLPDDGAVVATLSPRPISNIVVKEGTTVINTSSSGSDKGLKIVGSQIQIATSGTRYLPGTAFAGSDSIRIEYNSTAVGTHNTYLVQDLNILAHVSVDSSGTQWNFEGYHYVGEIDVESIPGGADPVSIEVLTSDLDRLFPLTYYDNYIDGDLIIQTTSDSEVGLVKQIESLDGGRNTVHEEDSFGSGTLTTSNNFALSFDPDYIISITDDGVELTEQNPDSNTNPGFVLNTTDNRIDVATSGDRYLNAEGAAIAGGSDIRVRYRANNAELTFKRADGPTHNMAANDTIKLYARNRKVPQVQHRIEVDEYEQNDRYITPKVLGQSAVSVKAWATFRGTETSSEGGTGTVFIYDDYNVSSLVDETTGIYRFNWVNPMINNTYIRITGSGGHNQGGVPPSDGINNAKLLVQDDRNLGVAEGQQFKGSVRIHSMNPGNLAAADTNLGFLLIIGSGSGGFSFRGSVLVQPIEPTVNENGTTTLRFRLRNAPTADVTINVTSRTTDLITVSGDTDETFISAITDGVAVTFDHDTPTADNYYTQWQDITITGVDNDFGESTVLQGTIRLVPSTDAGGYYVDSPRTVSVFLRPED